MAPQLKWQILIKNEIMLKFAKNGLDLSVGLHLELQDGWPRLIRPTLYSVNNDGSECHFNVKPAGKGEGAGAWYGASLWKPHTSGAEVWHVLFKDLTVLPAHARVSASGIRHAFAGPHLSTLGGWKAESALLAGSCPTFSNFFVDWTNDIYIQTNDIYDIHRTL